MRKVPLAAVRSNLEALLIEIHVSPPETLP
jgi:hypothetical protein